MAWKICYMVSDDIGVVRKFYHLRDAKAWIETRPELHIDQVKYKIPDPIDWDNYEPALF